MAEPGDPSNGDDHDDLIGFASSASLQGRARQPLETPEPVSPPAPEPEPDLFTTPVARTPARAASQPIAPEPASVAAPPEPTPRPVEAGAIFERPAPPRSRRDGGADLPNGGIGLYAIYALILFAVPTLGVSALVGLLAVTGRSGPQDALSQSHFIYQQRTLWAGAVAAIAGAILLAAPFALGVPILFLLALWLVLRGASGVWTLKSGRPIADPRSWWL